MATAAQILEAFGDIGYLQRGRNLLAKADPDLMRQMEAAVDAGDPMALRKLMAANIGLSDAAKARMPDMPYDIKPASPPSRDPMSFDERVARDPNINNAVSELGMRGMPAPQKLDAYRQIAEAGGADNFIDRLASYTVRPEYSLDLLPNNRPLFSANTAVPPTLRVPDIRRAHSQARSNWPMPYDTAAEDVMAGLADFSPAEQRVLRELEASDWLGFDYPSQAMDAILQPGPASRFDMSPSLLAARADLISPKNRPITEGGGGFSSMDVMPGAGIPSSPGTGLIPSGPRGLSAGGGGGLIVPPGRGLTTTGGPRDLSVQGMESPAPRGLPAPNRPRIEGPGQRRIEGAPTRGREVPPPRRPAIDDPEVPPRNPRGELAAPRRRQVDPRLVAAGIGAGAAGLHMVNQYLTDGRPDGGAAVADPSPTTADLAAESAPPPRVPVASGEPTPREQAHELIATLNLMRRNAGGEVPEAPAMQREINRLLAMSNQTMAAASRGEVAMAGNDPHAQATRLLAQLNQMRREAGGEVPQARQIMAEVARLQQMGDAQRNARTTAFPRRAG